MRMNINIERIVLDGFSIPYHRQASFQDSIELELQRLFTASSRGDSLRATGAVSAITGSDVLLADTSEPDILGRQIARSIYEGINR